MSDDLNRVKDKIAKLFNLGENEGAAENEAETALRQAEALMRKYGLERSEVMAKNGTVSYVWNSGYYAFGRDGKPVRKIPDWYSWLAVAIAGFTDTIVKIHHHPEMGTGVEFYGEATDVVLAIWFSDYLKDCIRRATRDANMGSSKGREDFRKGMSLRLVQRMRGMKAQRDQVFSSSTALVVVDDKLAQRNEHFGAPQYKTNNRSIRISGEAANKSREAADKVQFNKVVSHNDVSQGRIAQ